MEKKNIYNYLSLAHYITDKVSVDLLKNYKSKSLSLSKKNIMNNEELVTKIDIKIEKKVRNIISRFYPDHNVCGEELGETNTKSNFTWIIDPIDGTKAFASGIPVFSFLLSLKYKNNYLFGIVDQPVLGERYWNYNNKSYLNKKIIKTRKCKDITKATIAVTEPNMFSDFKTINEKVLKMFSFVRWGTDALGYMRCAEGILDGVIERNIKIWDVAAIEPIIKNAGGFISTWDGKKIGTNDTVCASGDKKIHSILVKALQNLI